MKLMQNYFSTYCVVKLHTLTKSRGFFVYACAFVKSRNGDVLF